MIGAAPAWPTVCVVCRLPVRAEVAIVLGTNQSQKQSLQEVGSLSLVEGFGFPVCDLDISGIGHGGCGGRLLLVGLHSEDACKPPDAVAGAPLESHSAGRGR